MCLWLTAVWSYVGELIFNLLVLSELFDERPESLKSWDCKPEGGGNIEARYQRKSELSGIYIFRAVCPAVYLFPYWRLASQ